MTRLHAGGASDVGRVRTNNEDQLLVTDDLFAVADGMGGHAGGEVAAQVAVEALAVAFRNAPHTATGLIEAIEIANRAVWDRAAADTELRGMGTTITAIALVVEDDEDHVAIANVGDSRAYLMRDGELGALTEDHSVAEMLVREGRLTPEEALVHPQRHQLTRVLGQTADVAVDCYPILPYRGDRYLLCSDGLTNEVSDDQIASVLRRLADPDEAVRELISIAKANGGHDNVTVVVVDVVDDDQRSEEASAALAEDDRPRPSFPSPAPVTSTESAESADESPSSVTIAETDDDTAVQPRPPRARRLTLRVVLFLLLFVVVLGGAGAAVGFYARGGYFVGLRNDEVVIFKGRPDGLLWFQPTVERRTGFAAADVPPVRSDDVKAGKEEPSLAAALRYVDNLRDEHARLVASAPPSQPVAP